MEEEIIFNEEKINEQNLNNIQKEEEIKSQKEPDSSQETSQYENSPKKEELFSDKSIPTVESNECREEEIEQISTYILNYNRNKKELNELYTDTNLKKSENCLYQLDIKLISKLYRSWTDSFLVIYCHELAAFSFDEIYERIYSLDDICKENRYFRIFQNNEEVKNEIDEFININQKNKKKFFIEFKNKELKIHMKLSFFDKEKEMILNIPKKNLNIKQKNELLPGFLKEIQEKIYGLADENNKLKTKNLTQSSKIKKFKYDLGESNKNLNKTFNNENNINEFINSNKTCNKKK